MGSGTTRKYNDSTIINLPKSKKGLGGGAGGGSAGQRQSEDMNKVCPPTFSTALRSLKTLPERARLHLQDDNIMLFGEKVGSLTKLQVAIVERCAKKDITYAGEIARKGDRKYGLFKRK